MMAEEEQKHCSKCKRVLPLSCFGDDKYQKSGFRPSCKKCTREQGKKYYTENIERIKLRRKKYYAENTERIKLRQKHYRILNKDKTSLRMNKWYKDNKDRERGYSSEYYKKMQRNSDYKRRFNITLADYDRMFAKQNGVCAICELPQIMRRLAVDHDHKTGKVRGLLCSGCNTSIGRLQENPETLVKMLEYLQKHNKPEEVQCQLTQSK